MKSLSCVVIANYTPPPEAPSLRSLWIGEKLRIIAREGEWACGHSITGGEHGESVAERVGIFPLQYVILIPDDNEHCEGGQRASTSSTSVGALGGNNEAAELLAEINATVMKWMDCLKRKYVVSSCDDEYIRRSKKCVADLIAARSLLHGRNLPTEELKSLRISSVACIDAGNHLLKLPMAIRCSDGRSLRVEELSIGETFRQYEAAQGKLGRNSSKNYSVSGASPHPSTSINSGQPRSSSVFICVGELKLSDGESATDIDSELLIRLAKDSTRETISETLTIHIDGSRAAGSGQHSASTSSTSLPINVAFSLSAVSLEDITRRQDISVVASLIRVSPMSDQPSMPIRLYHASGSFKLQEKLLLANDGSPLSEWANIDLSLNVNNMSLSLFQRMSSPGKARKGSTLLLNSAGVREQEGRKGNSDPSRIPMRLSLRLVESPFAASSSVDLRLAPECEESPWPITLRSWGSRIGIPVRPPPLNEAFQKHEDAIYVQLKSGSFNDKTLGDKKNIELSVTIHVDQEEEGEAGIASQLKSEGVMEIITPERRFQQTEYRSRVVLRESTPSISETIKVLLPSQPPVRNVHAQILYYNRKRKRSSPGGDSKQAPFALSYLPLVQDFCLQPAAISELVLLRSMKDGRCDVEGDASYLRIPHQTRKESSSADRRATIHSLPPHQNSTALRWTPLEKCSMIVQTGHASTNYTSNYSLLQLLRWRDREEKGSLLDMEYICKVLVEFDDRQINDEVAKLLPQTLDALFEIASRRSEHGRSVFKCIVHIIRMCYDDQKYCENSTPVLKDYVRTIPYADVDEYLLSSLIECIEGSGDDEKVVGTSPLTGDKLIPVLKSLSTVIEMAINSHACRRRLKPKCADEFTALVRRLLQSLIRLQDDSQCRVTSQNAVVKYFPPVVTLLVESGVCTPLSLSQHIESLLNVLSHRVRDTEKLAFIEEIMNGVLFTVAECRRILLPKLISLLLDYFPPQPSKKSDSAFPKPDDQRQSDHYELPSTKSAALLLMDLIDRLFPLPRRRPAVQRGDVTELHAIIFSLIRPLQITTITLFAVERHDLECQRAVWALLLSIYDRLSAATFLQYLNSLCATKRVEVMREMLRMLRNLTGRSQPIVPEEWLELVRTQNRLILKMLQFAKAILISIFLADELHESIWLECFFAAASLCCKMSDTLAMSDRCGPPLEGQHEVAVNAALVMRSLWFYLNVSQRARLMPKAMQTTLEVALKTGDEQIEKLLMSIFLDMLRTNAEGSVCHFNNEFIARLDELLRRECEWGERFRLSFLEAFSSAAQCGSRAESAAIQSFCERVDKLLVLLTDYHLIRLRSGNVEIEMHCHVLLMICYKELGQTSLYVSYLHKLYQLHRSLGNFVEAAMCLKKRADLLEWTTDVPEMGMFPDGEEKRQCRSTKLALKESHYSEAADLFIEGEYWEEAIMLLKELVPIYEATLFDFKKLETIHNSLAHLYSKITNCVRMESNYYLVAFFGSELPRCLPSGRKFIFRGRKVESYSSFKRRMMSSFYDFTPVDTMEDCSRLGEIKGKYIQIFPVSPQPSSHYATLESHSPHPLSKWYYKYNRVWRFIQSRPERRTDTKWTRLEQNDATHLWIKRRYFEAETPMPGIVSFAAVVDDTRVEMLSPVEVAVEKLQEVNVRLTEFSRLVEAGFITSMMNLRLSIEGALRSGVGGGIKNYEVFLTDECWADCDQRERNAIDRLKELLREHISMLEYALYVHSEKMSQSDTILHDVLAEEFQQNYRRKIEGRCGKAECLLPPGVSIRVKRSDSVISSSFELLALAGVKASPSRSAASMQNVSFRQMLTPNNAATLIRSKLSSTSNNNNNATSKKLSISSIKSTEQVSSANEAKEASTDEGTTKWECGMTHQQRLSDNSSASEGSNERPPPLPQSSPIIQRHSPLQVLGARNCKL